MKHAVLIMAHKNKEQLIRLIRALACNEFDFFVHLDSNWNLSENDLNDIVTCADNVYLASKRIHGELDHWSLPQITLNLIDDALKKEQKIDKGGYSYFILLSGQDYPIKSKAQILRYLEVKYPNPLIYVVDYDAEYWVRSKFLLVRWSHKIDEVHDRMKPGLLRKLRVAPYVIAEKLEKTLYGTPYERVTKYGIELYGGSAWWTLPHCVIDYIREMIKYNPKFIKEYKRTWTPEETFFQTMTMDYLFRRDELQIMPTPTYPNFETPTKPFRGHPHIITIEDFDRIMGKKELFARKFDIDIDMRIMNVIDEVINEKE